MIIYNAMIQTMSSEGVIEKGYIQLDDGKITALGSGVPNMLPEDSIDAKGGLLLPGFIDAHTHLGILEDGLDFEGDDCNESNDPFTPQMRALDGINPFDRCFEEARMRGITAAASCPGSANACGGEICAVKTAGRRADDMVIESCGIKFALGENPKRVYNDKGETPMTRMAIAALIREGLYQARRYAHDTDSYYSDSEDRDPPEYDIKCEALLPLLDRKQKAFFHCHRADDICTALRIAKEFSLDPVIIHGTEGHLIVEELAREHVPCAVGPSLTNASKFELRNKTFDTPGILSKAGLQVSIITDAPVIPQEYLPLCAGLAVKHGMEPFAALQAITINPARHAGIEDRVGSIEPGKDADLVLCAGSPFDTDPDVRAVYINGKFVE